MLDLEDDGPAPADPKVDELRNSAIQALKERDAIKAQLAQVQADAAKLQGDSSAKKTLEEQVAHLTSIVNASNQKIAEAEKRARDEQFRSSFLGATNKHKVRDDSAGVALLAIAQQTFREKDGAYVPLDSAGNVIYSKSSAQPMSVDEWMETQKGGVFKDLFSQPVGGGGKGSAQPVSTAGRIQLTTEQARFPTAEQAKAMADKLVDIVDTKSV